MFYLDCLVESIRLSQIQGQEVEIFISNDASTDQTRAYLEDLVKRKSLFPNLKVFHQPKKRDWMEHMMEMPLMVSGDYVWILGDDDLLMPGAVDFVLAFIKKKKPDVLLLNKIVKSHDLRAILKPRQHSLDGPVLFSSLMDMACRFGILTEIGFTSCLVFRREPVVEEDPWPWLKTQSIYAQTFRLFPAFTSQKCMAVDNVCVVHRQNNQRSDQKAIVYFEAMERIPAALLLLLDLQAIDQGQLNSILEEVSPESDETTTLLARLLLIIKEYPDMMRDTRIEKIENWRKLAFVSKSKFAQNIYLQIEKLISADTTDKKRNKTFSPKTSLNVFSKIKRETLRIAHQIKKAHI